MKKSTCHTNVYTYSSMRKSVIKYMHKVKGLADPNKSNDMRMQMSNALRRRPIQRDFEETFHDTVSVLDMFCEQSVVHKDTLNIYCSMCERSSYSISFVVLGRRGTQLRGDSSNLYSVISALNLLIDCLCLCGDTWPAGCSQSFQRGTETFPWAGRQEIRGRKH